MEQPGAWPETHLGGVPADLSGRLELEVPPGPYLQEVQREGSEPTPDAKPVSRSLDLLPGARLSLDTVLE